jgi:hypothetical protein
MCLSAYDESQAYGFNVALELLLRFIDITVDHDR